VDLCSFTLATFGLSGTRFTTVAFGQHMFCFAITSQGPLN